MKLQNMPDLVTETAILWEGTAELREFAKKGRANVAILEHLQEFVLAVKEAVAELLQVEEKAPDVRLDAGKKNLLPGREFQYLSI